MALDKLVIEQKLESEGLPKGIAEGLEFEAEENLTNWIGVLKPLIPKPIEAYTKDELIELAPRGVAKGLQGAFDSLRKPVTPPPTPPTPPVDDMAAKITAAVAAAVSPISQKLEEIEGSTKVKQFQEKIADKVKKAGLGESFVQRVQKMVKQDATDAEIDAEIADLKKDLAALGIKSFGTPGGGSSGHGTELKATVKAFVEQKKKQNK